MVDGFELANINVLARCNDKDSFLRGFFVPLSTSPLLGPSFFALFQKPSFQVINFITRGAVGIKVVLALSLERLCSFFPPPPLAVPSAPLYRFSPH